MVEPRRDYLAYGLTMHGIERSDLKVITEETGLIIESLYYRE